MIPILTDLRYQAFALGLAAIIVAAIFLRGSGASEAVPQATAPPAATVTARATSVARTPTAAEIALDVARVADLKTIGEALAAYHKEFASYPSTYSAFQLVCGTAGDAGCTLHTYNRDLPARDKHSLAYWYRSDGATYDLFSAGEVQPIPSNCPRTLPPALSGGPILCLSGRGSAE